jgi:putative endonuclease
MLPNGARGERYAAKALEEKGYTVLARNYSTRYGEIDLVAENGECIAFVEVKTRAARWIVSPAAAVTLSKQRRIIRTAAEYLSQNPTDLQPRFDVFAIVTARMDDFKVLSAEHFEGAFELGDGNRPKDCSL